MFTPQPDARLQRRLEDELRLYGIRSVLMTLECACEDMAKRSTENFNTVLAKQWARWAVELEALIDATTLTDPGRE